MSGMTPNARGLQRPSYGGLQPVAAPNFSKTMTDHRTASYNALIGQAPPQTPSNRLSDPEFGIGDLVNVPGDMYGTVKFIGPVQGKAGHFLGVELSHEFAARGKNDGDVDGVRYFDTTVPGSGIFLPVHRAEKRQSSPFFTLESVPASPNTPSVKAPRQLEPTTLSKPRFAQSLGPGARPASPHPKPRTRPSLARPESPLRKHQPLPPTSAASATRQFSKTMRPAALPSASSATARVSTPAKKPSATSTRPYSRTGSRLGQHRESVAGDGFNPRASLGPRQGAVPSFSHPLPSPSRLETTNEHDEIHQLRKQLADKDSQLEEQAVSLHGMEASLKELQSLMHDDNPPGTGLNSTPADVRELHKVIAEKDQKYKNLVADFDAHRADFRATIDAMEASIAETDRMYEERNAKYEAEIDSLRTNKPSPEDLESMESIATQLKSLEELVAELEDGLEDARRGEAEARSEVEHLRGEVERAKVEIKRARETATNTQHSTTPELKEDLPVSHQEHTVKEHQNGSSAPHATLQNGSPSQQPETEKWCAMCEKDGHLAFECPEESY